MNNLHRELAPVSEAAWADLESEARRTFTEHVACRRAVDVLGPAGLTLAAVGTGHVTGLAPPAPGVQARQREVARVVELRVPFTVSRRPWTTWPAALRTRTGSRSRTPPARWPSPRTARSSTGWPPRDLPGYGPLQRARRSHCRPTRAEYPTAVAQGLTALRLAGVDGPYRLLLSADAYTAVAETTDHGYPIREHVARVLGQDSEIIWAPAIEGALLLSARGGDYELHLGQDLSIGYLSHDASAVELYFEESLTFLVQTPEAAVSLG